MEKVFIRLILIVIGALMMTGPAISTDGKQLGTSAELSGMIAVSNVNRQADEVPIPNSAPTIRSDLTDKSLPGYKIDQYAFAAAGTTRGTCEAYEMGCSMGQLAVGTGETQVYSIGWGLWYGANTGKSPDCEPGDANHDGTVNVGDAVYIINYVFKGGAPPPNMNEGDANGDRGVNVGDAVYLIGYIFKGGPAPVCGFAE